MVLYNHSKETQKTYKGLINMHNQETVKYVHYVRRLLDSVIRGLRDSNEAYYMIKGYKDCLKGNCETSVIIGPWVFDALHSEKGSNEQMDAYNKICEYDDKMQEFINR